MKESCTALNCKLSYITNTVSTFKNTVYKKHVDHLYILWSIINYNVECNSE